MKINFSELSFSLRKGLLIYLMRTFVFLCCTIGFALSSNNIVSQNSKITVEEDVTLSVDEVFKLIMNQTDFTFFYEKGTFKGAPKVAIKEGVIGTNDLLKQSLSNGSFDVEVTENNAIIIKEITAPEAIKKKAQQHVISGKVVDEVGMPLPGATIIEKGTINGTTTDFEGDFTMNVSGSSAILVFTYIGYAAQEISLNGEEVINVTMKPDLSELDAVVLTVQARGQKKAIQEQLNSNTIKNVVAEDRLQQNPDANAVEAIGRLPGVSVTRSGGEGNGLVVRGLAPKYTSVTLNGVKMAATGGDGRETNISGISQYALQGAEVYKSLTADMDANSVAGTVNLKIRETRKGLHGNIMATGGYNDLNKEYSNYKYQGEVGNRFFNDKLGAFISVGTESTNRSTQTVSAGYETVLNADTENLDFLLSNTNLNLVNRTNKRHSTMITLDYKLDTITKLGYFAMYNRSYSVGNSQSKSYGSVGSGSIGYGAAETKNGVNEIFQTSLSGESDWGFLKLDYGVSRSFAKTDAPQSRGWNYSAPNAAGLLDDDVVFSRPYRKNLHPAELPLLYNDNEQAIDAFNLTSFSNSIYFMEDKNLDAYLNLSIPFKMGDQVKATIKTGYAYRNKDRFLDVTVGGLHAGVNQFFRADIAADENQPWIVQDPVSDQITAAGMQSGYVDDFLDGRYNYGSTLNFDRLNQISDFWEETSQFWYDQGEAVYVPIYGKDKIGYNQDIPGSTLPDQDIEETYHAGYVMAEFNIGDWLMFLPGVRYEKTNTTMNGFASFLPSAPRPLFDPLPGRDTIATRANDYLLPMVHLRISPKKWFYTHLAYTQTLSRPVFNQLTPNSFTNSGFQPFQYIAGAPDLKVEEWENIDAQFTFHDRKLGLLSISGFYKTVNNQIWQRNFARIKGDPLIDPFPDTSIVNVSRPENHPNEITLKGVELDLQASFGYLSNFLKYFTVSANYTYTESETVYLQSRVTDIVVEDPNGGRPTVETVRIDNLIKGPMLNQPKHVINASLGFNRKGTNVWLSYNFIDGIINSIDNTRPERDVLKKQFHKIDLQATQKLFGKLKGFQIIGNFANLNDIIEGTDSRGNGRYGSLENYGWTADLGIRYSF